MLLAAALYQKRRLIIIQNYKEERNATYKPNSRLFCESSRMFDLISSSNQNPSAERDKEKKKKRALVYHPLAISMHNRENSYLI